jgi:hypothetical protein
LAQLLRLEDYKNFDVEDVSVDNIVEKPFYTAQQIVEKAYENQPQIKSGRNQNQIC